MVFQSGTGYLMQYKFTNILRVGYFLNSQYMTFYVFSEILFSQLRNSVFRTVVLIFGQMFNLIFAQLSFGELSTYRVEHKCNTKMSFGMVANGIKISLLKENHFSDISPFFVNLVCG
jgi:hypothetical protein